MRQQTNFTLSTVACGSCWTRASLIYMKGLTVSTHDTSAALQDVQMSAQQKHGESVTWIHWEASVLLVICQESWLNGCSVGFCMQIIKKRPRFQGKKQHFNKESIILISPDVILQTRFIAEDNLSLLKQTPGQITFKELWGEIESKSLNYCTICSSDQRFASTFTSHIWACPLLHIGFVISGLYSCFGAIIFTFTSHKMNQMIAK